MDRRAAIVGSFLGDSKIVQQLRLRASMVAQEPSSVLLWGEPGTGKRLLAWLIHRAGRMGKPFLDVAAATLDLGALPRLFDDAGDGTLFFSQIEEARGAVQRGLAQRLRERLAGSFPLQARVIVSCGGEPFLLCERGALEPVLYQATAGTLLHLPPLRERPGDRRVLAELFLRNHREMGYGDLSLSPEALDLVETLELRGNAAELESLIIRIAVMKRRGEIGSDDVLSALGMEGEPGWRRARAEAMREFAQSYLGALLASSFSEAPPDDLPVPLREFLRLWRQGAKALRGESPELEAWLDGENDDGQPDLAEAARAAVAERGR